MRRKTIFTIILITLFSLYGEVLRAYDFSYTHEGKTLYYTIIKSANLAVEVTYKEKGSNYISGDVSIPSQVIYKGTAYKVVSVGDDAFSGCTDLQIVDIPSSVTAIGSAFVGCTGLEQVGIPSSVTSIADGAFLGCSNLMVIDLPTSITTIGNGTFQDCSSLMEVKIPSSVRSIGYFAFSGCISLMSIEIPAKVSNIGRYAFWGCSSLDLICLKNTNPPIIENSNAFREVSRSVEIEVPKGSATAYKQAYAWKEFSNIKEMSIKEGSNTIQVARE